VNAYDRLLDWASERGRGSWVQWRDACSYLQVEPNQAARRLGSLGHLEFDWTHNRFACAPPTAVLSLHASGCVLVTGQRRRDFRAHLELLYEDVESGFDIDLREPLDQDSGPQTWLIEAEMGDIARFCEAAGLDLQIDSGRRIARALPAISLEALAEPERPDGRYPRRWFEPRLGQFHPQPLAGRGEEGLWWVEDNPRRESAYVRTPDGWFHVPVREYGPYLAYPDHAFIAHDKATSRLWVDSGAPLPPLLARALTLQSGRLPRREGYRQMYVNVDAELAAIVAERLGKVKDRS
jgi:hypothetical protein